MPKWEAPKLKCGHRMCHNCLKRNFRLSIVDLQHMPPKCCTSDFIPLKHVDKLFDTEFKKKWNRKFMEATTKNRIYCPIPSCAEWIKPGNGSHAHKDTSRNYNWCNRCETKICIKCSSKWHGTTKCVEDTDTVQFVVWAKTHGLRQCYNCNIMVETENGLNHAIWLVLSQSGSCRLTKKCSRCAAEFCMTCGARWKTCPCTNVTVPEIPRRILEFASWWWEANTTAK